MMEAVLSHVAHDVKSKHVKGGTFRKLSKDHRALNHVKYHLHVLILVVQNDFGLDPFLEIIVRVHESTELVNFDLTNNHWADSYD
jgi:hypothetical protein